MKRSATTLFLLFLFSTVFPQNDSTEVFFTFRITDYTVKLNDSITLVQVNIPPALPISVKEKQLGILKHRFENGAQYDTTLIGWGRCHLVKGDYYYFAIHKYHEEEPEQGDLLYTKCKTPVHYKSPLFDINRQAIGLTTVNDEQFYHTNEIFYLDEKKEKIILDSMIADIRFTAGAMQNIQPENNVLIEDGFFKGKKLFDAMEQIGEFELREFLKFMVARPAKYAGNSWKISEIFATWIINNAPRVQE